MRRLIIDWGLPEYITENLNDVIFKFDDNGLKGTKEKGYHCVDVNVKLCICDKRDGKVLFPMDFFKIKPFEPQKCGFKIRLELLYVHDESFLKKVLPVIILRS